MHKVQNPGCQLATGSAGKGVVGAHWGVQCELFVFTRFLRGALAHGIHLVGNRVKLLVHLEIGLWVIRLCRCEHPDCREVGLLVLLQPQTDSASPTGPSIPLVHHLAQVVRNPFKLAKLNLEACSGEYCRIDMTTLLTTISVCTILVLNKSVLDPLSKLE